MNALLMYTLVACGILPAALKGFYWGSPDNNLVFLHYTSHFFKVNTFWKSRRLLFCLLEQVSSSANPQIMILDWDPDYYFLFPHHVVGLSDQIGGFKDHGCRGWWAGHLDSTAWTMALLPRPQTTSNVWCTVWVWRLKFLKQRGNCSTVTSICCYDWKGVQRHLASDA
jgi:hypothetical protein